MPDDLREGSKLEVNERLQQIKEREEKVIAADWMIVPVLEHASIIHAGDYSSEGEPDLIIEVCSATHKDDAEFIAHARADIPWLLSQLAAILAENQRLEDELDGIKQQKQQVWGEHLKWRKRAEAAEAKLGKMREQFDPERIAQEICDETPKDQCLGTPLWPGTSRIASKIKQHFVAALAE